MAVDLISYGGFNPVSAGCAIVVAFIGDPSTLYYLDRNGSVGGTNIAEQSADPGGSAYVPGSGRYLQVVNSLTSGSGSTVSFKIRQGSTGGPVVSNTLDITYLPTGTTPCPNLNAQPAPVLTATPVYSPVSAANDINLTWTASATVEPTFPNVRYHLQKKTDAGSFLPVPTAYGFLNTLSYVDAAVPTGHTYTYRVDGLDPFTGGYMSNEVTITLMPEIAAAAVEAWGILAA